MFNNRKQARLQQQVADRVARDGEEEILAVLEDVDTGTEFYMDVLDTFEFEGRRYVALFPFSEKRQTRSPGLVILRVIQGEGQPGQTLYESVRDRRELKRAFDAFFARYEQTLFH